MDYTYQISGMNVTQFRQFKKAVAVLCRLGISRDAAIAMILSARENRESFNSPRIAR